MLNDPNKKEHLIDICIKKYNELLNMDEWETIVIEGSKKDT